jgi:hypothetical protein
MKLWLSYSFGSESPFPLYDGTQSAFEPVAVEWNPAIYCGAESIELGGWYDELPLPNVNYQEIRVESMRAYHLLCRREELKDWAGVVRIVPMKPEKRWVNERRGVVVFVGEREEYGLACETGSHFDATITPLSDAFIAAIQTAGAVVFPSIKSNTSALLCAAINEGCRVVASDAGASAEYLSKFGVPGFWHVVHSMAAKDYIGAVGDLYGAGEWNSEVYCDEVPYG